MANLSDIRNLWAQYRKLVWFHEQTDRILKKNSKKSEKLRICSLSIILPRGGGNNNCKKKELRDL